LSRVVSGLGTTRLALMLSAVSGGWLMTFYAFAFEPAATRNPALEALGLGWSLLLAAGAAVGLAVCGLALNDVLDRRQDRVLGGGADHVARPVASGTVAVRTATSAAAGGLVLAVACAAGFGLRSVALVLLLGTGVIFYNLAARFVPAVGIVTLGLVQAMAMAIPNPTAGFAWPVLLTLTHVMATGLVHRVVSRDPPPPEAGRRRAREVWGVLLGWGFWCLVVLVLIRQRGGGEVAVPASTWVGPGLAVLAYTGWAWRTARQARRGRETQRPAAARRLRRGGVIWLMVYDTAWLASAGRWGPAAAVGTLLAVALAQNLLRNPRPRG
jgi:hypothetical protein